MLKRLAFFVAIAVLLAIVVSKVMAAPTKSSNGTWKYMTLTDATIGTETMWIYPGHDNAIPKTATFMDALNVVGADGWELVTSTVDASDGVGKYTRFVFKKPG